MLPWLAILPKGTASKPYAAGACHSITEIHVISNPEADEGVIVKLALERHDGDGNSFPEISRIFMHISYSEWEALKSFISSETEKIMRWREQQMPTV